MTLSFSTKWPERMGELAGHNNHFMEKIWISIIQNKLIDLIPLIQSNRFNKFHPYHRDAVALSHLVNCKLHTIRSGNRWKEGMKIHLVINNRTPERFQFAPTMICTGVQDIEIIHSEYDGHKGLDYGSWIRIDDVVISDFRVKELAINDGFPSVEAFFAYFNEYFKGQLVHWTDLRY